MTTRSPVRARLAQPCHHEALANLWLLFQHDMSRFTGALPDGRGRYRDERLRRALGDDPDWVAHVVVHGDEPVGLAVVRGLTGPVRVLTSFFVVAPVRRLGVGRAAALEVLATAPGPWAVAFQDANVVAAAFWRDVATHAAGDRWVEEHRPVPGRPDLPADTWVLIPAP